MKIRIPLKAGVGGSSTALTGNVFNTTPPQPRGIYLEGAPSTSQDGFIKYLTVDKNLFGCGFPDSLGLPPFPSLPRNAYVRPRGQVHSGNIGVTILASE